VSLRYGGRSSGGRLLAAWKSSWRLAQYAVAAPAMGGRAARWLARVVEGARPGRANDVFSYDATTGRMTQYAANINSSAVTGTLSWNANWTLQKLVTVDPYNPGNNNKTCSYTYDDLARLSQADCGSANWGQNFSYTDNATTNIAAFGNISETVISGRTGQSFAAAYSDTTNRLTTIGSTSVTYDSNGNILSDGFHTYTWDGEGKLATLDSNGETYDALGRRVEQYNGSAYAEIVYNVDGSKLALMSGQTVTKVFAPLSGGATAVYTSSGLAYYRHPDWLGSSRLASTPSRGVFYDGAYAPYGEPYVETGGATDRNFTGQNQDLTPGSTGYLYDFLYREYHSTEGRWISPDPAGINAVDPTNPQSWNRYAYVGSNPLSFVDPSGLYAYCPWGTVPGQNVCAPPPPITIFLSSCSQAQLIDPSILCGYPISVPAGQEGGGGAGSGTAPSKPAKPCDDSTNNRSRFFQQLPGLTSVAQQLNVPANFIVGLSSYESGWFDNHNVALNNLWGLTQGGGNNISFSSVQAGNAYFVSRVGPYIQGAQTVPAFFAGLQKEGYNSANPNYFSMDPNKGMLFNRISNIQKWGQACGVSF